MREEKQLVLHVGIASPAQMKSRLLDIVSGKAVHREDDPKIWFASVAEAYRVLSNETMILLELIRAHRPDSLSELAVKSGQSEANLRTWVSELNEFGLVDLEQGAGGKVPRVYYDRVLFEVPLSSGSSAA